MSLLIETLLDCGVDACQLRHLVACLRDRTCCACAAMEQLELAPDQQELARNIILMDPSQVEESALELGLSIEDLDHAKIHLWIGD